MKEETLTQLSDFVLALKASVEDKNLEALAKILRTDVRININGRFYAQEELLSNLKIVFERVEQIMVDIVAIEQSEIRETAAFVTYNTEISWIDQETWEEHAQNGSLSLQFRHQQQRKAWHLDGFTFQQKPQPLFEEPQPSGTPGRSSFDFTKIIGPSRASGGNLFSFWY